MRRLSRWRLTPAGVERAAFVLALCTLLVVLVTLPRTYWFDEAQTIANVSQPFRRMLQLVAYDLAPPLYYLLMFAWVRLVGTGEVATALPSVAFALAALAFSYQLGTQLGGRRVGRWTALLYATTAAFGWHSQETRMYALVAAAGVASTAAFHRLLVRPQRSDWYWYLGATLVGVHTHYAFWFLVYAQNMAVLWCHWRGASQLPLRPWAAAQLLLILSYLPLTPFLAGTYDRVSGWYLSGQTTLHLYPPQLPWGPLRDLLGLLFTPLAYWNRFGMFPTWVAALQVALVIAAVVPLVLHGVRRRRDLELTVRLGMDRRASAVLLLSIGVPLLLLTILRVTFLRYLIYVVPLVCALVALGLERWPQRPALWLRLGLVTSLALTTSYFFAIYAKLWPPHEFLDHWPYVAAYVEAHEQPGRELILFPILDHEVIFRHYYRGRLPVVGFLPANLATTGDYAIDRIRWNNRRGVTAQNAASVAGSLVGYDGVWLPGPDVMFQFDREAHTWQWFERRCTRTHRVTFRLQLPLNLYRYEGCPAPAAAG